MVLKEKIIELFENNKGEYLSGADIAQKLQVTRAAVWKAVKSMQDDGYEIDAVTNRGYRLSERTDVLSAAGIKKYLPPEVDPLDIEVYKVVTSTNAVLREKAEAGARAGTVVVAAQQNAGRGRLGRSFFSPPDSGLYISVLLRPSTAADMATHITTMAAVAVCQAVEQVFGKKPQIKWVNDVFLDGKKICGILTEASFSMENGRIEYAVLGVGINVYTPEGGFPEELRNVAGNVLDARQDDARRDDARRDDARNRLAAAFLRAFLHLYADLENGAYIEEYRQRSLVIGQRVTVLSGGKAEPALALGIDDECRLLVRYDDGSEATLSSGEISIKL